MVSPKRIEGAGFSDERGKLRFFNTFDMHEIVRFYEVAPSDSQTIRAWQGHENEKKWFYCNTGSFMVHLIKVNDPHNPSEDIIPEKFLLDANKPSILEIPGGYANGFRAMEEGSKLLVFSNFGLEESKKDDFRYPVEKWEADWK